MKQSHLNSFFKSSASVPVHSDGRDQQQSVQKQKSGKRDYKSYETKKRDRVWQPNWQCTYSWLRYDKDTNIMYCESCREFSHLHPNKNIAMIKGKYDSLLATHRNYADNINEHCHFREGFQPHE